MEMGTPAVPATFGTAITSCQHSAWEVRMSAVSEGLYARLHPAMRGLVLFYGEQTLEPRGSLKNTCCSCMGFSLLVGLVDNKGTCVR